MSQQLTREEQERKYPNDTGFNNDFKNDEAFEEALKEVEGYLGKEEQFKGHLADSRYIM